MAGIPDMLTDIRTTGQGVPMGGQPPMGRPPMGGPPPGQPPMGRPPMGGGIASMGKPPMGGQPPMGQPPMGGGQPPMGMEEPPMEEPMSVEKDAAMLAEATMGRTGGDPEAAAAILQTATQMIMSVGQEDPMMGGQEDPMMMNMGGPMYKDMGGPLYAQEGMPLMDDSETLKQMIMNGLKDVGRASIPGAGKFDKIQRSKDNELTALSNSDMNYQDALDMLVKQRKN